MLGGMKLGRRSPKKPSDAIAREKSKRHSAATKKGIKRARKIQRAVLKAASRSKGKSKSEVAAALFAGHVTAASVPLTAAGRE